MSDEQQVDVEVPEPRPKQYLVMVDEMTMAFLGKIVPSMLFVQVEGVAVQGNSDYRLLVNPIAKTPAATAPVEDVTLA
jgi:hypothetical protein